MVGKYCDGVLPEAGAFTNADRALIELLRTTVEQADASMVQLDFSAGLLAIKEFVDAVNLYVTEQEPWKVAKDVDDAAQVERLHTILYVMCDSLRALAVLYNPVMPKAMASLWQQLGANESLGVLADQQVQSAGVWGQLQAGATITKGESLFPRLEEAPE